MAKPRIQSKKSNENSSNKKQFKISVWLFIKSKRLLFSSAFYCLTDNSKPF